MMTPTEPSVSAMTCCGCHSVSEEQQKGRSERQLERTHEEDALHVVAVASCRRSVLFVIVVVVVRVVVVTRSWLVCTVRVRVGVGVRMRPSVCRGGDRDG